MVHLLINRNISQSHKWGLHRHIFDYIWSFAGANISAMTSHNFSPPFIPWPSESITVNKVLIFYLLSWKKPIAPSQDNLRISWLPARLPKAFVFTIASVPCPRTDWLSIEHLCLLGPRTVAKDFRIPTASIIIQQTYLLLLPSTRLLHWGSFPLYRFSTELLCFTSIWPWHFPPDSNKEGLNHTWIAIYWIFLLKNMKKPEGKAEATWAN